MPCRYIALLGNRSHDDAVAHLAPALAAAGLMPRLLSDAIQLFASADTPTLSVPGGGVLVGRVFDAGGVPYRSAADFPDVADQAKFREFLLKRCWGEYVLLQPATDDPATVAMLRDPSGGIACMCSLEHGLRFATSDISLATQLGLYRKQVDWDFIAYCLLYPHAMTHRTGLSDIRELLPGCLLRADGSATAIEQAWSPWDFVAAGERLGDPAEAAERVRHSVRTAVRAWARIDRSILLELSGGLDSSIIAACLRDTGVDVSCCTLLTPVPGADERQYAGLMADALGVALCVEELGFGLARFDEPPPPWSVSPRINVLQHALNEAMTAIGASEAVASHFSGGSGDTVFCYLGNAAPAADACRELGIRAGVKAMRELSHLHQCTLWKAARLTLAKLLRPPMVAAPVTTFLGAQAPIVPPDRHPWFDAPTRALPGDRRRIEHLAGTQLCRHSICRGPSRELRMPLLSQPVIEACLKAPTWMWIAGGRNRSVARAAFAADLPHAILHRRSKGDFAPYLGAAWRRNKQGMRDFLLEGELQAKGLLDTESMRNFFERRLPPRDQSFHRIFELCTIENWVRHQH
jgi:asparagine synthase (glutamine-hydrolysing)